MGASKNPSPVAMPTYLRELIRRVCEKRGVAVEDVLGPRKDYVLTDARREIWVIAHSKNKVAYSSTALGRYFGRDHSTVIVGMQRYGTARGAVLRRRCLTPDAVEYIAKVGYDESCSALAKRLGCSTKYISAARTMLRRQGRFCHVWDKTCKSFTGFKAANLARMKASHASSSECEGNILDRHSP